MRLHLPKALLAAVLAACAALPTWAADYTAGTSATPITSGLIQATPSDGGTAVGLGTLADSDTVSIYTNGGYLPSGGTIDAALEIKQLILTNGTSNTTYTFNGAITGKSGAVFRVNSRAQGSATGYVIPQTFTFVGDLSGYYGSIEQGAFSTDTSYGGLTLQFSGAQESNTVAAVIRNSSGTGTISSNTEFTGSSIAFGTLTIDANKSMTVNAATTLTVSSALNNNGALVLNGTYTGTTITQGDDASLTLASGSVVNVGGMTFSETIGEGSTAARVDSASGFQTYSGTYTIATGGTITNQDATFKVTGETFTGGSLSGNAYTVTETRYNIAEGATETMLVVQQAATDASISSYYINILGSLTGVYDDNLTHGIRGTGSIQVDASTSLSYANLDDKGAEFTGSIKVLGNLTGVSDLTLRHTIDGSGVVQIKAGDTLSYSTFTAKKASTFTGSIDVLGTLGGLSYVSGATPANITGTGTVQVNGVLEYYHTTNHTFLNNFGGILEIVSGGDVRLGGSTGQLGNLTKIKVLSGGILRGYTSAKPATDLELAGGTLLASGQNWTYGADILVSADSRLSQNGNETLTVTGNITNSNNAGITSTGTVTLQGAVTLGSYTVQNGTVTMEGNTSLGNVTVQSGTVTMVGGITTLGNITVQSGSLNLGMVSGNKYASKDISVGDVTVNAGATFSVGYTKGTVKSVSLAAGSILRYYDNVSETEITNASDTTNITSLRVNAAANTAAKLQADWKGTLNISELTGAGDLALSKEESAYNPYFFLNISSIKDYSGTITGPSENASFMTVTIGGADISDAASTATVSADVTLKAGFTKTGAGAVSFGGTTNATDVTVSSGSLTFAGGTSISKLSLNGGTTTISGATTVSGVKENGIIAADDIKLTISDMGTLTHDGFKYTGTELSGLSHGLTMWNANNEHRTETYNVTVSGGTLTQTATGEKGIYAALKNVKLINGSGTTSTLGVNADLSGADIKGTLSINETTTTTIKNTFTDSTGAATDSSIATLTGKGTLKTTGGTTEVTNASGFSGTLAATGGNIELQTAADLTLNEVVVSGGSSISGATSYTADKVSIGEGTAGSLVGSLSIKDNGTITLDASAGATTETGGTKGLSLSALTTTFADEGTTTTAGSLTLGSGLTLNLLNLDLKRGQSLTLFSGVTSVNGLSDDNLAKLTTGTLAAEEVFSGVGAGDFNLSFDETNHIVALVAQRNVPEPTTATLSLLALMGLAARRRRRKA